MCSIEPCVVNASFFFCGGGQHQDVSYFFGEPKKSSLKNCVCDHVCSIFFPLKQQQISKNVLQIVLGTDDMDLAGDIIQALANFLNVEDLNVTADFPDQMETLRQILIKVIQISTFFAIQMFSCCFDGHEMFGKAGRANLVCMCRLCRHRCEGPPPSIPGPIDPRHELSVWLRGLYADETFLFSGGWISQCTPEAYRRDGRPFQPNS